MRLTESDFRRIQQLVTKRDGSIYSIDYIRKVYNGKRKNAYIMDMTKRYIKVVAEMESKIERLSKARK
ncbi:MAG: hypothetical protein AAGA66_18635 [Bacteroidota bacterium]